MRIEVANNLSRVFGTSEELKLLDAETSYPIEGAQFTAQFRQHRWDGREHLLKSATGKPYQLCPTGALADLPSPLRDSIEFVDVRRRPGETVPLVWKYHELRDYQARAVDKAVQDRGVFTGMGMWNMAIRSGKTKTAVKLVQQLGLRTLWIAPGERLQSQAHGAFLECIEDCPVGLFGAGQRDTDWITVATAQALLRNPKKAIELLTTCDILIVDEAHHLEGEAWRRMILRADAYYKIGLSATVFVSRVKEQNKASIWLKACTGPIIDRVSMNYLIDRGWLAKPQIVFYRFKHEGKDPRDRDWQWVARERLAQNRYRNALIADLAQAATKKGMRVLVDTGRKDQLRMIAGFLAKRGVAVETMDGDTKKPARDSITERFRDGELMCVVGTVLGEGVDIPELEVVINAEGQKKASAAIQRMRNLTPSEGKTGALFIDIADLGQPILAKHALERMALYEGLRGFSVRAVERNSKSDPLAI